MVDLSNPNHLVPHSHSCLGLATEKAYNQSTRSILVVRLLGRMALSQKTAPELSGVSVRRAKLPSETLDEIYFPWVQGIEVRLKILESKHLTVKR